MIDRAFCDFLEYEISSAFENSDLAEVKGFWCDGVACTESDMHYSSKYINDKRQTTLKAYIGKGGQSEYKLTLYFGPKTLSRYARNLDLIEFASFANKKDALSIDIIKKEIEIQLD